MADKRLKEMLDFLSALRTSGANMDDDETVKQTQQQMLQSCLVDLRDAPSIRTPQFTQMLKDLQDADIPEWMREDIRTCVQNKVLQQPNPENLKPANNKTQRHMHLHNFLTQEEWTTLRSSSQSANTKLHVLCKRFQLLRLTCPSEPTCVLAISILVLSSHQGAPEELQVSHQRTFKVLEDFKATLKIVTKRTKRSDLLIYPDSPRDLPQEMFKEAYPGGGVPTECPLDVRVLNFLSEDLPARKSRATLSNKQRSFHQNDGFNLQEILHNPMLARMLQALQQPQDDLIQMLPTKKKKIALQLMNDEAPAPMDFGSQQKAITAGEDPAANAETPEVPAADAAKESFPDPAAKTIEKETQPAKSIDEMAAQVQRQLAHNKSPAAKVDPEDSNGTAPKSNKKGKGKGKGSGKTPKTIKKPNGLKCPGTKACDPIHWGKYTIYTCPKSFNWRVKRDGEKKDKAFGWKSGEKQAWERLVEFVNA
eukprot:Skav225347  [mRNA]  locus=scaffold250:3861:5297:+ [translate_table: standard]